MPKRAAAEEPQRRGRLPTASRRRYLTRAIAGRRLIIIVAERRFPFRKASVIDLSYRWA